MRTKRVTILTSRNEMTKNDFIETVLFIINKILYYSSSLNQITPTLFDRKNIIKKSNDDISTNQSSNEENDSILLKKEDKFSLADYLYYWVEKMGFKDNLLILTMMNIDKI